MTSVTLSLPDETYRQLNALAQQRGTSIDQLFDDMAAWMVAESEAEARFRLRAARGQGHIERGLELLRKAAGDSATAF